MKILEKITKIKNNNSKVFDAGKQTEYDTFWDSFQLDANGNVKTNGVSMFSGAGWTDKTFKPKHKMLSLKNAERMFRTSGMVNALYTYKDYFDFSKCTNIQQAFAYSGTIEKLGTIDSTSCIDSAILNYLFTNCYNLYHIDLLVLKSDGSQTLNNTFLNTSIREIRFAGVIGNDISITTSVLSRLSMESIVSALSDTVTGKTVSFSKTAKEAAFTADEWSTLTATKSNWTFNLI